MENPDHFRTDHLRDDQDGVVQGSDIGVLVKNIVATGNNYASYLFESERKGFVEEFGWTLTRLTFLGISTETVELPDPEQAEREYPLPLRQSPGQT